MLTFGTAAGLVRNKVELQRSACSDCTTLFRMTLSVANYRNPLARALRLRNHPPAGRDRAESEGETSLKGALLTKVISGTK